MERFEKIVSFIMFISFILIILGLYLDIFEMEFGAIIVALISAVILAGIALFDKE